MELYDRLADIFEISDLNIDKANRRTLLKYAKRTKFQRRREAFYSVCDEGTRSKVAICKTDERPTWVHNLETLKTKQLRVQLKGFLKELGILVNPKYTNMLKLSKEKRWHAVVYNLWMMNQRPVECRRQRFLVQPRDHPAREERVSLL